MSSSAKVYHVSVASSVSFSGVSCLSLCRHALVRAARAKLLTSERSAFTARKLQKTPARGRERVV